MDYKELANAIFPNVKDISYYEEKYPIRKLPAEAIVTRYAPSPTGFSHIGGLYQALIARKIATQTNGVFFLRIEDTDQKREIENGVTDIINGLKEFNVLPDEGMTDEENSNGNYAPYKQSQRKEIYHAYAKFLVEKGLAYPCFCKSEELNQMRQSQETAKLRTGYYGVWAKCRLTPINEAIEKIKNGEEYILRFKSPGNPEKKIKHHDLIKGNVDFPENDQDIVIIKSDGLPTYHFAHAIDDHLMGTNCVIRGDEWLSSIPLHLQLFTSLGFVTPKYAHIAPIMKEEDGIKRKLSKRKDPEAAVSYYSEQGIPHEAVSEYLLNIANSNFEQWRKQNPDLSMNEFVLQLNKMSVSGALFDMIKLLDISKRVISKYSADMVYNETILWAEKYDSKLKELLEKDKNYTLKVLGIERGNAKPRRDISKYSEVKQNIEYMFEEEFFENKPIYEFQKINNKEKIKNIINAYIEKYYNQDDDKDTWFNKMKDLSIEFGYAGITKEYKENPDLYKGHVGDISTLIRICLTNRNNTPDMYEIMLVLGKDIVIKRLQYAIENM